MSYDDHDPLFEGWDHLDWKQRRERRFQRLREDEEIKQTCQGV